MTFHDKLQNYIEAGFQVLYIPTAERERVELEIENTAKQMKMKIVKWDAVNGFEEDNGSCKDPLEALLSMDDELPKFRNKEIIFVMRNLHIFMEDPIIRQALQNLYYGRKLSNLNSKNVIIIISNILQINEEINQCVTVVDFALPDIKQLDEVFLRVSGNIQIDNKRQGAVKNYTEEQRFATTQALLGLTTSEAENVLAYSLRVNRGFNTGLIDTIEDEKAVTLKKSEVLTYIPKDKIATMDQIGGYDVLKEFINIRKLAYTQKAKELNLDLPRGIVLLGIPGTGKSLVGRIIARELNLPLVMLDVSAIFGSLVGESERRIRTALSTIDALDGSVVMIDEAEKALGGADQSVGDSGVARRVFGVILTWLTEKKSRTFAVLTMNRTKGIPPEFLRRGRFDEIFATDLPDAVERDQIFRIHCKKRCVDVNKLDTDENWAELIKMTNRYVGAEIEQIVCDARFAAFASRQSGQPTIEELKQAAATIKPIADTDRENIQDIEQLCNTWARPVSSQRSNQKKKERSVKM